MLAPDVYEVLEEELLEVVQKKDKESVKHFLMLLFQQVELKKEADEKNNRMIGEFSNIRSDIKDVRSDLKVMLEVMSARFEAIDKRFEAIDKRFEDMNKRFEDMNKRFEDMDKRFNMMMWFVGALFTISTAIMKFL